MMLEASRSGGTVELMRGPCGAPCAREGLSRTRCGLRASFRREVFDEKCRRRCAAETWALRLKSQKTEMDHHIYVTLCCHFVRIRTHLKVSSK